MTTTRFLWTTLAALGGVAAVIAFRATAQDGPDASTGHNRVVEARQDGTLVERTVDGRVVQTFQSQPPQGPQNEAKVEYRTEEYDVKLPDGSVNRRRVTVPVLRGGAPFLHEAAALDAESKKLLDQEQAAAQEARRMADNLMSIEMSDSQQVEQKKKLREKLAQVFDLQQQRRNHEIAKIEDRLAKLKETLKKREAVKDSIVDRRLETITGGVDELGWEETFPGGPGGPNAYIPTLLPGPVAVPPKAGPYGQPGTTPVPPPVAPRAELPPTVPGPGAGLPPAAAPVPVPPLAPTR